MFQTERLHDVHDRLSGTLVALADANDSEGGPWPGEMLEIARLLTEAQSRLQKFTRHLHAARQPGAEPRPPATPT
jgi:hypothetical protein